jgi:hypothetical protein
MFAQDRYETTECDLKILLATPAHGGHVCTGYHKSVLDTLLFFKEEYPGIQFVSKIISLSLLPRARNVYASIVLNDPTFTHLLFIDSDMAFGPELIANMLAFNKPLTGVVYPKRHLNYDEFHRLGAAGGNPLLSRVLSVDYIGADGDLVTTTGSNGERVWNVQDGFVQTKVAGTGIMLIARAVLETMLERFPELWVPSPGLQSVGLEGGLLQCFDPINLRGDNGLIMGEDFAFCRRWVEGCGGEIWVNVDQAVMHIGQETFVGKYILKLEQIAEAQRQQVARTTQEAADQSADLAAKIRSVIRGREAIPAARAG